MTPVLGQLDTAVEWLSVHSVSVPAVPSGSAKLARPSRAQFGCLPSHNHRRSSQPEYVKVWRMANNSYLNVSLKVLTKLQLQNPCMQSKHRVFDYRRPIPCKHLLSRTTMTVSGMVYRDEQMVIRRHVATVGITGWSTVKGHCSVGLSRKFYAAMQVRRRLYSRDSLSPAWHMAAPGRFNVDQG